MITTLRYSEGFFRNLSGYRNQERYVYVQQAPNPPVAQPQPTPVEELQELPKQFKQEELYLDYYEEPTQRTASDSSYSKVDYQRRERNLHHRDDLTEDIKKARSRIHDQKIQREEILKFEQEKINQVGSASKNLERLIVEQDVRASKNQYCFKERKDLISCFNSGDRCEGFINLWRKCEESTK